MELQDLINKLPSNNLIDTDEFLHIDDCLKSNEELTNDEIHLLDAYINPNKLSVLQKLRYQILKLHINNSQITLDNFVKIVFI
ncbi:hypothetical protein C1646_754089 [Rhizophagus diaphanus]|nr:hypothetical protein C1646_754089 [Rhizophagus diaphanus] [Rhizophagus sp. MUCL 43196]